MRHKQLSALILILSISLNVPSYANTYDGLINQIKLNNPESEIITLSKDSAFPYFAIKQYTFKYPNHGTIIIVHDRNEHADWPILIHPMRLKLTEYGWNTISLQFPDNPNDSTRNYSSLLNELLNKLQTNKLILIVKGENTHFISTIFANILKKLDALVLISHAEKTADGNSEVLKLVKMLGSTPLLDIYAKRDKPSVTGTATYRMNTIREYGKTSHVLYQQIIVPLADHRFMHQEMSLIKRIAGWVKRNAKKRIPIDSKITTNKKSED